MQVCCFKALTHDVMNYRTVSTSTRAMKEFPYSTSDLR